MLFLSSSSQPLSIGDTIPAFTLGESFHSPGKIITAENYGSPLTIYAFIGSGCVSSVRFIAYLDSLQKEFGNKCKILLLTTDTRHLASRYAKNSKLPLILVNDSVRKKWFPHNTLPHLVWIKAKGKIAYITKAQYATGQNIQEAIEGKQLKLPLKYEYADFNSELPLWKEGNGRLQDLIKHYSLFMKKIEAFGGGGYGIYIDSEKQTKTLRCINQSILTLFRIAYSAGPLGPYHDANRIIIETADKTALFPPGDPIQWEEWSKQNVFCFENTLPFDKADRLYLYMQEDLNRWTNYSASVEKRKIKCRVLVRTSSIDKLTSAGGKFILDKEKNFIMLKNIDFKEGFVRSLIGQNSNEPIPVIDETGYSGKCDLTLNAGFTDFEKLKLELHKYDLDLIIAEREIPMLVIRDK